MLEIDPRVLLRASLDKIIARKDLEESVRDCEEVLRHFSDIADRDLRFMKSRDKDSYLGEQLEYDDLTNVGHYCIQRQVKKNNKIVSFLKDSEKVSFWFERGEINVANSIVDSLVEKEYNADEMLEISAKSFAGVIKNEKIRNPNEYLLGKDSRSLNGYKLSYVTISSKILRNLFGFNIPFFSATKTETIYRAE